CEDSELIEDSHGDSATVIRELKRDYQKRSKLPQSLVEEMARATVLGQQAWVQARKDDDFASFSPVLTQIIDLKRQQAEAVGYEESPYDALLDDYEPGETTANVHRVLSSLREDLVPLVAAIAESSTQPEVEILSRSYPVALQKELGERVSAQIGFDFQRGRLDVTHHPFCSGMGPFDCRITTRYDEHFFPMAFFGILHESGHGIYDQGLRTDFYGLPPGEFISLGIHESQSRMWENQVGRGRAFWQYMFPTLQETFASALTDVTLDQFYFALNEVRPSLIRVEADEVTYNLHIIIRFELEQALIQGDLQVPDLPAAWREKYREFLGIEPPSDADGVLQDIHWGAGLIGYFPTYSLGNLYSAQFFAQAAEDLGDLEDMFSRGEFMPLKNWLQEKIHQPGKCYRAAELVERITGQPLSHEPLLAYLRAKLEPLYGIG
ncbi:MAG: carboxypeptidase M32, partial [Planctomycetota bacterium]|nr:carboxypeptidase M32 [Planctomycetota bacterium]